MSTPADKLDQLNKAQALVLSQRAAPTGAVTRPPSGLERVLKQPGELANKATTARGLGELAAGVGDALTGGPILRAGSKALEQARPALQEFTAGLTGTEPGQPATVTPVRAGVVTPGAKPTQGVVAADQPVVAPVQPQLQPRAATAAAPATDTAQSFLDTTARNREALIKSGGIEVIRGLNASIDTPFLSKAGFTSTPLSQLAPGGFEGARKIAAAGGSPAVATAAIQSEGAVKAAGIRAGATTEAARLRAEALGQGAVTDQPTTDEGIIDQINFTLARGVDSQGNPLTEEGIATLLSNKKQIQKINPSLAFK